MIWFAYMYIHNCYLIIAFKEVRVFVLVFIMLLHFFKHYDTYEFN